MQGREFWVRHLELNIGDIVYYVIGEDSAYSIKKTRIVGSMKRARGIRGFPNFVGDYLVFQTEDGRLINESFRERKDELDASQVFLSKEDAVQYIIHCLQCEINCQKQSLLNAQQRLAQAERALKTYEKYGDLDGDSGSSPE